MEKEYRAHWPLDNIPCSAEPQDVMTKLLMSDTAKRLPAAEMVEHQWMTGGTSKTPFLPTVINKPARLHRLEQVQDGPEDVRVFGALAECASLCVSGIVEPAHSYMNHTLSNSLTSRWL
jgi:uncharacterized protein (DUF169 family)